MWHPQNDFVIQYNVNIDLIDFISTVEVELEAKKKKMMEEQNRKKRFTIPRPTLYPPECSNVGGNSSSDSSTYYNFINNVFSTFSEDGTYEEIDKRVLKGTL